MKKLATFLFLLMTIAANADVVYVPLFQTWDPGNAVGTLNDWIINELDPTLQDLVGIGGGDINLPPAGTTGINGTCPVGYVFYNNSGQVGCQAGGGATTAFLNVQNYGFVAGGQDNAPSIPTLMAALGNNSGYGGQTVIFPGTPGQAFTAYYFSSPLVLSANGEYKCSGTTGSNFPGTELVFAAGQDGVIQEDGDYSSDGGYGEGIIEGCLIVSLGDGGGFTTPGASTITTVSMNQDPGGFIPASIWHIGDGVIATGELGFETAGAAAFPAFAPGAYISGVSGSTLTLAAGYTANSNLNAGSNGLVIYQLPVALKYTVQTTNGSPSILVTAGPRLLIPGDVIWSDAFPFGTTVYQATGTLGNQTVIMSVPFLNTTLQNASVTHGSGSPGQLWVMPAGLMRRTAAKSSGNFLWRWPIGLEMPCSSGSTGGNVNCTTSHDSYNVYEQNLVGRWTSGNNTGASDSTNEEFATNFVTDVMEGGTVGSTYINLNSNSGESGSSLYSIMGNCGNDNFSVFVGGYIGVTTPGCAAAVGLIPPTAGPWPLWLGPVSGASNGSPQIGIGTAYNSWKFNANDSNTDNCVGLNSATWYALGVSYSGCSTATTLGLGWNSAINAFQWVYAATATEFRVAGSSYLGYTQNGGGGVIAQAGIQTGDNFEQDYIGMERLLDSSSVAPTDVWHLRGDVRLNQTPLPGGNLAWTDAMSFSTTLGGAVTQGVTTSVAVASCPSPALPAGTPIVAFQNYQATNIRVDQPLGTLSSCSATTLTFQAAAAYSSLNGTTIEFLQWQKVGTIQDSIPAISSCGTGSPAVTTGSNNLAGQFTMGTGTPTACTITFAHAYPTAAFCTVTPASSGGAAITGGDYLSAMSASGFTWTLGTGTNSLVFDYTCGGN